jgi:hypothetical protein
MARAWLTSCGGLLFERHAVHQVGGALLEVGDSGPTGHSKIESELIESKFYKCGWRVLCDWHEYGEG